MKQVKRAGVGRMSGVVVVCAAVANHERLRRSDEGVQPGGPEHHYSSNNEHNDNHDGPTDDHHDCPAHDNNDSPTDDHNHGATATSAANDPHVMHRHRDRRHRQRHDRQ
jgi:hypothetical protein